MGWKSRVSNPFYFMFIRVKKWHEKFGGLRKSSYLCRLNYYG